MNFKKLENNWEKFGQRDPFWAVFSIPGKESSNYWKEAEFFKTGETQIEKIVKQIKSIKKDLPFKKALDFGCGVGRLTQALSPYFEEVIGIDIASSMIKLAKKFNKYEKKCKYYINKTDNLRMFPSNNFEFVYSNITLQHMEIKYIQNYIKEFIRILKPNGLLIFQCPSKTIREPSFIRKFWYKFKRSILHRPMMEMHAFDRRKLSYFLQVNGAKILRISKDNDCGPEWISYHYYLTK